MWNEDLKWRAAYDLLVHDFHVSDATVKETSSTILILLHLLPQGRSGERQSAHGDG